MNIRAKEVKHYLEKRDVKTNCCIEKEDLVNKFMWYADIEAQIPKGKNKKNFLNGFMNTLTSSMPNLLDQNFGKMFTGSEGQSQSPINQPADQATASSSSSRIPNPFQAYSSQQNNTAQPEPSAPPDIANLLNDTNQPTAQSTSNGYGKPASVRKLVRLSDITNVEDIQNLSSKQLKELLFINRIDFKGCVEKEELVKKAVNLWSESRNAQEPEDMLREDLCKICMDAPLNSVLLECGHIATCIDCGKQLAECPICRQYIVRVVHTFKA